MLFWLEQCRKVYNFALRERKDWMNSRQCAVNACSLRAEFIIPVNAPYPDYYKQKKALTQAKKERPDLQKVDAQVLQDILKRLDKSFKFMKAREFGFPRFKKFGQIRSFVFPQFRASPLRGTQIKLPKVGLVPINLHRPLPDGFDLKQVRVVKKASGWYAQLILQCEVQVPDILPHGEPIGIDLGLEKFLAVSTGALIQRPRFFVDLQGKLKWLQRKLRNKKQGSANYRKVQAKIRPLHEQPGCCMGWLPQHPQMGELEARRVLCPGRPQRDKSNLPQLRSADRKERPE